MSTSTIFTCPACSRTYAWKPELAGKRVKCKCGESFSIPLASSTALPQVPATAPRSAPIPPPPPAASEEDAKPSSYPGLGRIMWIGALVGVGAIAGISWAYYSSATVTPPVATTYNFFVGDTRQAEIQSYRAVLGLVYLSSFAALGLGAVTALAGLIARLATSSRFPRSHRPHVIVRVVLPILIAFAGVVLLLPAQCWRLAKEYSWNSQNADFERQKKEAWDAAAPARAQAEAEAQGRITAEKARLQAVANRIGGEDENARYFTLMDLRNSFMGGNRDRYAELHGCRLEFLDKNAADFASSRRLAYLISDIYNDLQPGKGDRFVAGWLKAPHIDPRTADAVPVMQKYVAANDLAAIGRLLDAGFDPVEHTTGGNAYCLVNEALENNRTDILKLLLAHHFPPDHPIAGGYTPLQYICDLRNGNGEDSLRLFLQAGADPNKAGPHTEPPLLLAIRNRHENYIRLLMEFHASAAVESQGGIAGPIGAAELAKHCGISQATIQLLKTNGAK